MSVSHGARVARTTPALTAPFPRHTNRNAVRVSEGKRFPRRRPQRFAATGPGARPSSRLPCLGRCLRAKSRFREVRPFRRAGAGKKTMVTPGARALNRTGRQAPAGAQRRCFPAGRVDLETRRARYSLLRLARRNRGRARTADRTGRVDGVVWSPPLEGEACARRPARRVARTTLPPHPAPPQPRTPPAGGRSFLAVFLTGGPPSRRRAGTA